MSDFTFVSTWQGFAYVAFIINAFALPIAGMALVLVVATMVEGMPLRRGAAIGVALGLALWTHSQAILLVPLFFLVTAVYWGLGSLREYAKEAGTAVVSGLAIVIWPYLKNIAICGSPVFDTPEIFILPGLEWNEYFTAVRGLKTAVSTIQYGVLRGWFDLSNFGFCSGSCLEACSLFF